MPYDLWRDAEGTQHDQPPLGLRCERCHLIFLADSNTRGPRDE